MAGVDQDQSPEAMLERFRRVLPGHSLGTVPEVPTFPEPRPLAPTNLARPACAAGVAYHQTGIDAGWHRAFCDSCDWHGPTRFREANAQDDADDHNESTPTSESEAA